MKRSDSKRKKKSRILIATLGVAALIVGGLTFAWYTSQDSVTNTFQANGTFKTVVVENFNPPLNWEPGATTDKVVQVTNTGTIDAYTRVTISPEVTVKKKMSTTNTDDDGNVTKVYDTVEVTDSFNPSDTDASGNKFYGEFATVDWQAIDAAATGYNTTTDVNGNTTNNSNNYGNFVNFNELQDYTLKQLLLGNNSGNLPPGVTLYVKESGGETDLTSSVTLTTKKYEFLGYYGLAADGSVFEPAGQNTSPASAYELNIEIDNSALESYGYTDEDGFIVIRDLPEDEFDEGEVLAHSTLKFSLYKVKTLSYTKDKDPSDEDYIDYNDYITLNFYKDAYDTSNYDYDTNNWYKSESKEDLDNDPNAKNETYYYYRHILKSGATTPPLLESVTFNSTADTEDVSDITVNVVVDSESTQAIMEAGIQTFGVTDSNIDVNVLDSGNIFATSIIDNGDGCQIWQNKSTN